LDRMSFLFLIFNDSEKNHIPFFHKLN